MAMRPLEFSPLTATVGMEHAAAPPDLRKGSEGAKNFETCHAERSEASLQFFVSSCSNSDCGDPSLRSESVTFFDFWPFGGT
jgi:hypothetical protein